VAGGYQLANRKQPAATAAASAGEADRKVLYWYDPMVPTQKFDQPGKSPFMDMQLVPRYADEAQEGGVSVSPQAQQSLGLRLATVEQRGIASSIEVLGTVQLSERDISIVQARASGFVERVYPLAPGDVVAAGAPLVELLLPEWEGAQREYLAVKALQDETLRQAARQRLRLLGMTDAVIAQVEQQRHRAGPHHGTPAARRPAGRADGQARHDGGRRHEPGPRQRPGHGLGGGGGAAGSGPAAARRPAGRAAGTRRGRCAPRQDQRHPAAGQRRGQDLARAPGVAQSRAAPARRHEPGGSACSPRRSSCCSCPARR
jgi:hypothetical protein